MKTMWSMKSSVSRRKRPTCVAISLVVTTTLTAKAVILWEAQRSVRLFTCPWKSFITKAKFSSEWSTRMRNGKEWKGTVQDRSSDHSQHSQGKYWWKNEFRLKITKELIERWEMQLRLDFQSNYFIMDGVSVGQVIERLVSFIWPSGRQTNEIGKRKFCEEEHRTHLCDANMTADDRWKAAIANYLCFLCLKKCKQKKKRQQETTFIVLSSIPAFVSASSSTKTTNQEAMPESGVNWNL